jgi:hypothetical protein
MGGRDEDKEEYDYDERLIAYSCYDNFHSYKNYDTEKEKGRKKSWRSGEGTVEMMKKWETRSSLLWKKKENGGRRTK